MTYKLEPGEGYVISRGLKIHYLEWGRSGRLIVALHSMTMDAHAFDTFSRGMATTSRILAIDLLGHGESDKPTSKISLEEHMEIVRGVIKKRHFSNFTLIGHSVGGYIAIVYAAKHPDELSRLVLVDIAPRDPTEARVSPRGSSLPESFNSKEEALNYFRERFPRFTPEALENRMMHGLQMLSNGKLRLKASAETIAMLREMNTKTDLRHYLQEIKAPTLLVKGAESQLVSQKSITLMKTLDDFSMVEVAEATHLVPQDQPEKFEHTIRNFISQQGYQKKP